MKNYIATFYTHYGALKFHKACAKIQVSSRQMPVPRKLSSSCGTCVMFETDDRVEELVAQAEDLEGCYLTVGKDQYQALNAAK